MKLVFLKSKKLPVGSTRKWKGGTFKKISENKWELVQEEKEKKVVPKQEEKSSISEIPVKGLNKNIDFKANEKFLNDEIKDVTFVSGDTNVYKMPYAFQQGLYQFVKKKWNIDIPKPAEILGPREFEDFITLLHDEGIFDEAREDYEKELIEDAKNFAQNLTPVHSLSIEKFVKVLKSGGLKALSELEESGKNNAYAYIESEVRPNISKIAKDKQFEDEIIRFIYNYVDNVKPIFFNSDSLIQKMINVGWIKYNMYISDLFEKMMVNQQESVKGAIGYDVDKEIGTNKHVFSIIGPNGNGSGYGEISIVLKQDIMKHPDFNMTPAAGTSFVSGNMYGSRSWVIKSENKLGTEAEKEQWVKDKKTIRIEQSKRHFHKSKLNAKENPDYYKYMAKDIAAQGTIEDYLSRQSHGKWEGHLPVFVPANMFAEVIMTRDIYDELVNTEGIDWIKKIGGDDNIKIVKSHEEILPYMNDGFKSGKWRRK